MFSLIFRRKKKSNNGLRWGAYRETEVRNSRDGLEGRKNLRGITGAIRKEYNTIIQGNAKLGRDRTTTPTDRKKLNTLERDL